MAHTILCPQCRYEIEVTEVLSTQLRAELQREFEADMRRKETALEERANGLTRAWDELKAAQNDIDRRVAEQLAEERKELSDDALAKAREQVGLELRDRDQQLIELQQKLEAAEDAELGLRRERRELEEEKRSLDLTLTRRLDEERARIRAIAKREADEERQLRDADKDKLIGDLQTQIESLKRKSEQGSEQLRGEVLEITLEDLLRRHFPFDEITPVPIGVAGGDVLQTVRDTSGTVCGSILWESKRTKNWNDGWLPKLRDDQRAAKAELAILVTQEMPKDVSTFRQIDGIWVTSIACAIGVGSALRGGLLEVAALKRSLVGRNGKMEMLYAYLSGQEFRLRVEGIVEAFVTLRQDLEAEKRAMQRVWAKREKQLERAVTQTAGMYGDLSGIIGGALPQIERLELPLLPPSLESLPGSAEQHDSES